jgi:hypothetical protein
MEGGRRGFFFLCVWGFALSLDGLCVGVCGVLLHTCRTHTRLQQTFVKREREREEQGGCTISRRKECVCMEKGRERGRRDVLLATCVSVCD